MGFLISFFTSWSKSATAMDTPAHPQENLECVPIVVMLWLGSYNPLEKILLLKFNETKFYMMAVVKNVVSINSMFQCTMH